MSENYNKLFEKANIIKNDRIKKSEISEVIDSIFEIDRADVINSLLFVMPITMKKTYSLDRDLVNIIDDFRDNLKNSRIATSRSAIVNAFLDLTRIYFKEGKIFARSHETIVNLNLFPNDYFDKYLSITRREANSEQIEKFEHYLESGKNPITLDLSKINNDFLVNLYENNKELNRSNILNVILNALIKKVSIVD
jgi:hypothetical protein